MATKFISDSSSDLWEIENIDFTSVPLCITTTEANYIDDQNLDVHRLLGELASYKGRSYTACPSIESWLQAFGDADTIYIATMTSTLSGTYNSAMTAVNLYLQDHPHAKIHVFDTLSTGPEQRLLIEKLIELDAQGLSFEEVRDQGKAYLAQTRLFFALQSLHNLAQNGRVSKVVASAVGALGIRLFGTASEEGTLEPMHKCRGDKKLLPIAMEQLRKAGFRGGRVRISHIENPALAEEIKSAILTAYPTADIQIYTAHGLCSYYAERGGLLIGCECPGDAN